MAALLAFLLGLALGSFLNVVATRLPRREQFWAGRSRCPHCRTPLPWYDNIPLLSHLVLKGRCRFCGAGIPLRYPLLELAAGLLSLALWLRFPWSPLLLAYWPFVMALLVLSVIDLEHLLLPDLITYPGIILGLVLALFLPHVSLLDAVLGALLGGGFFYLTAWLFEIISGKRGLGGGDVKLMAMIGAFLGWEALPYIIFIGAALGAVAGLTITLAGKGWKGGQWRATRVPFGPFLALAAILYIFATGKIVKFFSLL